MNIKFDALKIIAIILGVFTFCWMFYDHLSNKVELNKNYVLANQAFLKKKYKEAEINYNKALLQDSQNIYYIEGKARALFRQGNFIEAEKLFLIAVNQDREFAPALANLGILYDTLGEYKKAIKYYKLAVNKETKVTKGIPWLKRFLKNIQFKPSNIEQRLVFLQNRLNADINNLKMRNFEIDKLQPDFEM